jgi:thiamine monophosphate kinase
MSTSLPPTAKRLARQTKSRPATQTASAPASRARVSMIDTSDGLVSPTTAMLPAFTIPALSRAMPSRVGPRISV